MQDVLFETSKRVIAKDILKKKTRGYISYIRGEQEGIFPDRIYPKKIF